MSVHARLSASSAHRWLACPPSVNFPGGKSSIHAATGTFAHDIAAKCLNDKSLSASDFFLQKKVVDGFEVECDLEMVDAINVYLDEATGDTKAGDKVWIEAPMLQSLSKIDPDLGGTADYIRYRPAARELRVFDFKYGSGVYVDADDNDQMKVYALGAMLEVDAPVTDVVVTVVQPRFEGAKPVRDWKFKAFEILDFISELKTAANRSRDPKALYYAGDHCKFCPGAAMCPELERKSHALIADEFQFAKVTDPAAIAPYNARKLAEALTSIPLIKERIKAIEEFAYAEATAGKEIPGYKLVDKRPTRKWKSEGDVIEWAEKAAIDPYAPRELLSPAQLEKKLAVDAPKGKKKEAGKAIEPFVERVSSGTALVPVSDDRPPAKLVAPADFDLLR